MSNYKKLIIPLILLVVLVGVYFVITNLPEQEDNIPDNGIVAKEEIQIFEFVKNDLKEIIIEKKNEKLHFRYETIQVEEQTIDTEGKASVEMVDRNVWISVEPANMKLRSSSVDSIAWNANSLKAAKLIEENPSDLSVYGLDNPDVITFIMNDNTQYVLHLGNTTPTGGAYYAKKVGESAVYTIGDYEAKKFLQTKFELMETNIYDKEYTTQDMAALKFSRNGELLFDATVEEDGTRWMLSFPIEAEARYENMYAIGEAIAVIGVSQYIDENTTDLAQYGLESPHYVFEYNIGGEDYKLSLGKKQPNRNAFYALLNDENLVFTIDAAGFTFLDKPIEEIINPFVHLQNINEVSEMRVTMDGRVDISKINVDTEDEDNSTYEFNDILMTPDKDDKYVRLFKKYYQGAIGLTVDKLNLDVNPALVNPVVNIEYTLKTGERIVVDLVSEPNGVYFYAFKNQEYTGLMVRQSRLDEENRTGLRISYEQLMEALKDR
ncbi:MAG TPA: DUF4340 domain-containing protein [Thermoclostridium sp.]|nr:DUF4340 domain-containing protein [Thermoclostridium sp.]